MCARTAVKDGEDREAHLAELTASAYVRMRKTKQDQSIVFVYGCLLMGAHR